MGDFWLPQIRSLAWHSSMLILDALLIQILVEFLLAINYGNIPSIIVLPLNKGAIHWHFNLLIHIQCRIQQPVGQNLWDLFSKLADDLI